jgi:hypothetical protein
MTGRVRAAVGRPSRVNAPRTGPEIAASLGAQRWTAAVTGSAWMQPACASAQTGTQVTIVKAMRGGCTGATRYLRSCGCRGSSVATVAWGRMATATLLDVYSYSLP